MSMEHKTQKYITSLYNVMAQMPFGVIITDLDFKIIFVNQKILDMYGHSRECLIGKDPIILNAEPGAFEIQRDIEKTLKNNKEWCNKILNQKSNGEKFVVDCNITSMKNEDGVVIAYMGFQKDATEIESERSLANSALIEEKNKAQKYLDIANVIIVVLDKNGFVTLINKKGIEVLGYQENEIINQNWFDKFIPERCKSDLNIVHKNLISGNKNGHIENYIVTKDGEERLILWNNSAILDNDNNVVGSISSGDDITERNKSEEALDIFKRFVELSGAGVGWVDLNGKVCFANQTLVNIFGDNVDNIYKNLVTKYYDEKSANIMKEEVFPSLRRGESWEGELTIDRKDGTIVETVNHLFALKDSMGGISYFANVVIDITDEKESEKQLLQTTKDLQNTNKELEQFAYIASHDMQEPLRVIASYCGLIQDKYYDIIDEDGKKYINYVISSAARMKTLIKELLDFSRVGRKDNPFEYVSLKDLLDEVLSDYHLAISDSNANIIIEAELPKLFGIRFRLKQLISNLISNALKFKSNKDPIIQVGCCEEDVQYLFYIKDNGVGIESKYFDRIFGIFKRLYSIDEYPGTGIGLALCKRIVETHGGKIWVDSTEGEGTYVYFTIPKHVEVTEVISL